MKASHKQNHKLVINLKRKFIRAAEIYLVKGEKSVYLLVSYALQDGDLSFMFIARNGLLDVRLLLFVTQRPGVV